MNTNNLTPKLRFPEFKNDGEWKEFCLGEVLKKNSIKNKKAKYTVVQSVSNKYGFINQDEYFDDRIVASKDTSNYYVINKGCFAYNPSRIDVGSLAYKQDDNTSIISPLYVSFRADNTKLVDLFLLNFFISESFKKQIIFEGGVRNTLNYENLTEIKILLPSILEQQKIADCLTSIDEVIAAHTRKLELLKAQKKGLMQNLFPQDGEKTPKFRFKEFEKDGEWEEMRLGDIYDFKITNSFTRDCLNLERGTVKNIHYGDIHTKFHTLFDITKETVPYVNQDISIHKIKKENYCIEGDIIFADASEDLDDIGKSIEIVCLNKEKLISGLHTLLARQKDSKIAIGFGGFLFKSDWVRKQIRKEAQGTKILSISETRILGIRISYPQSTNEQQKIASCLSSLDAVITAQSEKIEQLKLHKKGLMQGLFPKI